MNDPLEPDLLTAVLDSWDRHNRVLTNLVRALPPGGLAARASGTSPSVSAMLTHAHHERLCSVLEETPEHASPIPDEEWAEEADPRRIAEMLDESAARVRDAVGARIRSGRPLDRNFSHPVALIHFLIFHESYHHGQIKLALKAAGVPLSDDAAGPVTWDVWRARAPLDRAPEATP